MPIPLKAQIGKGIFLVAAPNLRDPNFRQTVVLLCEHGAEGALGVVVNRPTAMSVSEALPQVPVLEGQRHVLFSGGPVQPNQVMLLYRLDQLPDNSHHVFDGVCLGGDMELVDKILTTSQGKEAFRAYVGYSGWGPGQLESEMRIGSWITVPADPAMVFEKDPTRVWSEIVSALGEEFRLYADMPFDPSLNLLLDHSCIACSPRRLGATLHAMTDPSDDVSFRCAFSRLSVALLILIPALLSGCGVAYTIIKSESKFDKLTVPMTKAEVVEEIGGPDRILRDDGRMLVWEYSLTARRQWLYELGLCPISVWVGGCIIYPFTNVAMEHQREYPHHVVLINDELCARGTPVAILQRRRACETVGYQSGRMSGTTGRPEPVVTGLGPINRDSIDRYKTMAVMLLEDAPD